FARKPLVGGMMLGEVALYHDVAFETATHKKTRQSCVWATQVDVRLTLDPVIYVAQDLQQKDCWHREIYRHELLHLEADRVLLEKYRGQITDGLNMVFATPANYMTGPVKNRATDDTREKMRESMTLPLGVMFDKMMRERGQVQQAVDTPEEYARVASICAHEELPQD
ncbi:MAG: hypothetical protein KJ667_04515, partial [Alphaproteobacteria bacterium]|nr:hypothetical protein [Alphaproteobacteria bacterium]